MIISVLFLILEAYTYKYLVPHYIKTFYDTMSQDSYLIVSLNCIIIVQRLQYLASELQITFKSIFFSKIANFLCLFDLHASEA